MRRHKNTDKTPEILVSMLKENTGRALLDSGDHYGRNWEQNQAREFEAEQATTLSFKYEEIDVTHNVYHWLKDRLVYSPTWQRRYDSFVKNSEEYHLTDMENFGKYLKAQGYEVGGIYGDGEPMVVNTYNHENLLSQTIQFVYMEVEGNGKYARGECLSETLILLQIHGGCDARGGYTAPKLFVPRNEGEDIFDYARATIYCEPPGKQFDVNGQEVLFKGEGYEEQEVSSHQWDTENGHNWYPEGNACSRDLREIPIIEVDSDEENSAEGHSPGDRNTGMILVDSEGRGHCPVCGGKLSASAY